jgi:hypothetical protein
MNIESQLKQTPNEPDQSLADDGRKFHGWRLLAVVGVVILLLAAVSAGIDLFVIGPLEGR